MIHRERKIFSGDPAWLGILLLAALWLFWFLPAPPPASLLTEAPPAAVNVRGR
ncbi:MAG: hypothetical protein M3498_13785 [Deinococcota bacterium]|jgi:hypothetical protein|nr:hypothetical protein [Deinococcota bacterium]